MLNALQRKIGRHNPLCAASRLGIQATASLPMASTAEFSHQYFLVAAETCLQVFRFVILFGLCRVRRVLMYREVTGQGALDLRKIREAEDLFFCGFRILGEPLRATPAFPIPISVPHPRRWGWGTHCPSAALHT